MSFAEIKKLKELLKTLQESGEVSTKTRMDVGKAIEKIQKERSAAKMMASADVSQPIGLLESSFEKSSILGERWKPPWDPTWNPLSTDIKRTEQEILSPRAFDVNLNSYSPLGVQRSLTDRAINKIVTADIPQKTKETTIKRLEYRRNLLENAETEISGYSTSTGLARILTSKRVNIDSNIQKIIGLKQSGASIWSQKELDDLVRAQLVERDQIDKSISRVKAGLPLDLSTSKKLESLDDGIYKMGATQWDEKRGIPLDWMNTNKAYETPTAIEQLSGSFFTGARIPGTLGTDLLSSRDPEKVLNKATVFTQKQWGDKEAAQQELQFINNYLLDPQMAAEYAKTAPFSFFKYWSQKGGTLGLKEHMQSLKVAARADDVEVETAKWGALTMVKDVKTKDFTFASLRGQVTELWDTTSQKISQVGLLKDSSGESIKFTVWKNQQQNIPKVEVGKNYYFGNVASQEWQGRWNLNVNQYSAIEEIKPMPFNTAPSLILPGSKVELRDYSKPYSIDPAKGMITYTTKSGKVVEMPIQQAGTKELKTVRLGDEPGDLAAFLPFAGLPFLMGNVTGGTAQIDSQQSMRINTHPLIQNSLAGAYNNLGELGSIWYQNFADVYADDRARVEDFDKKFKEGTLSPYRQYLPLDIIATGLGAVGAALTPLSFIDQGLYGEYTGIGAMEGIRTEIQPSEVMGIEDPIAAFGANLFLQPSNLLGAGLFKKGEAVLNKLPAVYNDVKDLRSGGKGLKSFLSNEAGTLEWGPKTRLRSGLRENQATMGTNEQILETLRLRSRSYAEKPTEFFQEKYGLQYEKIKSEYMAAEGVTAEEFENIAKKDPTFADKMTTWIYGEYGKSLNDKDAWNFFNFEVQKAEQAGSGAVAQAQEIDESFHWFDTSLTKKTEPIKVPLKPKTPTEPRGYYFPDETVQPETELFYNPITKRSEPRAFESVEVPTIGVKEQKLLTSAEWDEYEKGRGFYWDSERPDNFPTYYDTSKTTPTKPIVVPKKTQSPAEPAGTYIDTDPNDVVVDKATLAKARRAGIKNKIARTVGIAAAGSILFGLPDSEREYNKPQAREPLYPSNEKGFWGSLGDVATYDNYVEGAAMLNGVQSEKVYTPEDRITPSMALGIQNRDTSLFSIRGAAGTFLIDMPVAPTSYISLGKYGSKAYDAMKGYVAPKMGQAGVDTLMAMRGIKDKYSPKGDLGQPGKYDQFLKNTYDPILRGWKYFSTLANAAYYPTNLVMGGYTNFLGGVTGKSYFQATKLMLGMDKEKVVNELTGQTGYGVMKGAEEAGLFKSSGAMDVPEYANPLLNAPVWLAQKSEAFLRLPGYLQKVTEGMTSQEAEDFVVKYQGAYNPDSYSRYEREVAKRLIPFYGSLRFAIPRMAETLLTNQGKLFQIEKLNEAAMDGQDAPPWALGSITWGSGTEGSFNYKRTPMSDMVNAVSDPIGYAINSLIPIAKTPMEIATGKNSYTGKPFDSSLPWWNPNSGPWSNLLLGRQGYNAVNVDKITSGKDSDNKALLGLTTGIGTAATQNTINAKTAGLSDRDMYSKVTGRPNDFSYEQRLALMQRDNWSSAQSGISGKFEQLQGGHFYPAVLGGPPLPWNYITQTREENSEWLSAQNYIENLPERELQQEEAWGRVEQEYSTGVEEINTRTLDNSGRTENEAQKEKKRYDLRKSENIKIYNRQLNTVRSAKQSAEKDIRGEKKKVEDARAKGYSDPASEAQIKVIEDVLTEYRALYEKVSRLRDEEQGKEFELPVQGTDLSRFQPMDIGGYDKYAVRYGRGKELAKPEDIEKLVDLKKITAYYAASKSYGPVAGFRPGTPEEVKNRILFTRDARYQELAQIANPLISGAGWEGISGKNYIGPRNISEIRRVVEGSVSEPDLMIGGGEPPAWYSDQQVSQEPDQTRGFDYNDPEFREVVREIIQETLSEGIVSD